MYFILYIVHFFMYYVTYTECSSNYDTIGKRSDSMCKILFDNYLI